MYDLMIIGGGPAGLAASVYAARKQLNTLLISKPCWINCFHNSFGRVILR
ncbi:hypothetical protein ES705_49502 [subsurface metagenome]